MSTAACHHMPEPGTGRTVAQNRAFHTMKAKLGHDRAYEIVREVTGGDDHSCTTTKEQMHEILNRMRLALGESPERYNRERRRRMVRPQQMPRGMPRVMTARQAEYIEDLAKRIGFDDRTYQSWCMHYLHKAAPETSRDAQKCIEMLKPLVLRGWHPETHEEAAENQERPPAEIIQFARPDAGETPAPTDDGSPDVEVPF